MQVLDQEKHARLLEDLPGICETANIPPAMVRKSMTEFCGPPEVEWVKAFRTHKENGLNLALVGQHKQSPDTKLMAIGAALLRNFVDARLMPVNTILDRMDTGDMPSPSVLLIPNLFLRSYGKAMPAWKVSMLYDLLLQRLASNKPTVLYAEDLHLVEQEYGQVFCAHIKAHYRIVEGY